MKLTELLGRYGATTTARVVEIDMAGGRREVTHAALAEAVQDRIRTLSAAGVREGHVVGIAAGNSLDWIVWDLATLAAGVRLKAFADTTRVSDPAGFVAEHGLALLVADEQVAADAPAVVRPAADPTPGSVPETAVLVDRDDVHSMVYSSGTSGRLKGLDISFSGTEYVIDRFVESFHVTSDDRHLIFLPLSNYQQRLSVYCCLWLGADLILAPYQRVFTAVRAEHPTFLIGPPVFYDTALGLWRKQGGGVPLQEFLGGTIRFLITGMAPIRRETLDAYGEAGVSLLEAYGMTETGMIAWNTPDRHRVGTVGALIDTGAVRFLPDGEILIDRPAPLSRGYFDTDGDESAAETFQPDGTIRTGDFGRLDEDGFLTLVGRKKDLIILGSGLKVHPAEVEQAFTSIEEVEEIVVVAIAGTGRLGGVVTLARQDDATVRDAAVKGIAEVNQTVQPHHRLASLVFSEAPLRSDPRFLTANMKLSRTRAAEHFAGAQSVPLAGGTP